jgi:hypothetical protein
LTAPMRSFESIFLLSYSRLRSSPSTWICAPFVGMAANSESLPCRRFANPLSLFGREVHGELHSLRIRSLTSRSLGTD